MSLSKRITQVLLYLIFAFSLIFYLYLSVLPWFTAENIQFNQHPNQEIVIVLFHLSMLMSLLSIIPTPIKKFYYFRLITFGIGVFLLIIYNPMVPAEMNIRVDLVFLTFFYSMAFFSLGVSWVISPWKHKDEE